MAINPISNLYKSPLTWPAPEQNGPKDEKSAPEAKQTEPRTQFSQMSQELERINKDARRSAIELKLKCGTELSEQEMKYLALEEPELYEEAAQIKKERDAYKKALKNCRSRQAVQRLHDRKMNEFLNESNAIKKTPGLAKEEKAAKLEKVKTRLINIEMAHLKFIQSDNYKKLPLTDDEAKPGNKKKGKGTGSSDPISDFIQDYVMQVLSERARLKAQSALDKNPELGKAEKGLFLDFKL